MALPREAAHLRKYSSEILPAHSMHRSRGGRGWLRPHTWSSCVWSGSGSQGSSSREAAPPVAAVNLESRQELVQCGEAHKSQLSAVCCGLATSAPDVIEGRSQGLIPYIVCSAYSAIQTHRALRVQCSYPPSHLVVLFATVTSNLTSQSSDTDRHLMKTTGI